MRTGQRASRLIAEPSASLSGAESKFGRYDSSNDLLTRASAIKSNLALRIIVSSAAFALVAIHMGKPELKVDSISILLLVVCALPWAQPLIKTVELLGVKIELQELHKQVDEARGAAASASQKAGLAMSALGASQIPRSDSTLESGSDERVAEMLAREYENIRNSQPSGSVRTSAMTSVVRRMMETAQRNRTFDALKALESGRAGDRLYGYAHIFVWPSPDYLGILVKTITSREDAPFGQYWGIQALSHVVTGASNIQLELKERLRAFANRLPRGSDREYELNRILKLIE